MINIPLLIRGTILFLIGQILVWYQINGQFLTDWIKQHPLTMSLLGVPISYVYIYATEYLVEAFKQPTPRSYTFLRTTSIYSRSKRDFRGDLWRCKGGFVYLRGKVAVAAERN
jgi:hypothetical protein